jgi:WD40 repeat protein
VCLVSGERRALTTDTLGTLCVWDVSGSEGRLERRVRNPNAGEVRDVRASPDGSLAVTPGEDGSVTLWTAAGETVRTLREAPAGATRVWSACFSADGSRVLAACCDEKGLLELDVGGSGVARFIPAGSCLLSVDASADGRWVVTADSGGGVQIWEGASLAPVRDRLVGPVSRGCWGARFSPDSRLLAVTSDNNHVCVWRVSDWSLVHDFREAHAWFARRVCWSADSSQLITSGGGRDLKVWDAESGRLLRKVAGHGSNSWGVTMSRDGSLIVSCGFDKQVRLHRHKPPA